MALDYVAAHRREGAGADMQGQNTRVRTPAAARSVNTSFGKMESGGRRGDRAGRAPHNGLVVVSVGGS